VPLTSPSGYFESYKERDAAGKNQRGEFIVMSWLPGWNTIAGAHGWESAFFWGSIIALILLGVTEVASHRAAQRKDELTEQQQTETQQRHNEEIARLHLETAQANDRAANLEKEAAAANVRAAEIMRATAWRQFTPQQFTALQNNLAQKSGKLVIAWIANDAESLGLAIQFSALFNDRKNWEVSWSAKTFSTALLWGISIPVSPGAERTVDILRDAFSEARVTFSNGPLPPEDMSIGTTVEGNDRALIVFGSKRPSFTQPPN
jgi:hypothetical protein